MTSPLNPNSYVATFATREAITVNGKFIAVTFGVRIVEQRKAD